MRLGYDLTADFRRMVDAATDAVLMCWGRSMRGSGSESLGYPTQSAGFVSGSLSSFDDMFDAVEEDISHRATVIIYAPGFSGAHRSALAAIYAGGQWVGEGDPEITFLEAVNRFEKDARGIGLL